MPGSNLLGHEQPKVKTINVDANLLEEWSRDRQRTMGLLNRRLAVLALGVLATAIAIPLLARADRRLSEEEQRSRSKLQSVQSQLGQLSQKAGEASPIVERQKIEITCQKNMEIFLGQVALVLNAAPSTVTLSNIKCDVLDGDLTLRCRAEAETSVDSQQFCKVASTGPRVLSATQSSTRISSILGPQGVAFEFQKRVKVGS